MNLHKFASVISSAIQNTSPKHQLLKAG